MSTSSFLYVDISIPYKKILPGIVEDVVSIHGTVKVKMRIFHKIHIGDKMASFFAQKTIVSALRESKDMPFDENGVTPDIILGPTCFNTRMTVNQIIASGITHESLRRAAYLDATGFRGFSVDKLVEKIKSTIKCEWAGDSKMFDGKTGRPIRGSKVVSLSVHPYMRQKHLVSDKVYSRETGPIDQKTRQPVKGRPRDGGIRFEEMALHALNAHGASNNVKEILNVKSDGHSRFISNHTNFPCTAYILQDISLG